MPGLEESVRSVLSEVDKFLDALKSEKLSSKISKNKDKVIELLKKLRNDFPQLQDKPVIQSDPSSERNVSDGSTRTGGGIEEDDSYSDNIPDTGVKDLTNPQKCGFLEKKRKKATMIQKAFQKRYCVIQDGTFYYFDGEKAVKQSGAFLLSEYEFRDSPNVKEASKKDLCFELVAPGKRSYQFLAPTAEEYKTWKTALGGGEGSGGSQDVIVEGEMEDIYEEMPEFNDVKDKVEVKERVVEEAQSTDGGLEDYDDAESVQKAVKQLEESEEIYDDVDNVDKSKVNDNNLAPPVPPPPRPSSTAAAPALPPPVKSKPKMPLPELPPSTKQEQPLPEIPPARPEKAAPKREKLYLTVSPDEDYDNMYYGKWDCKADTEDELSFKHGEIIHIINREYDSKDWWIGRIGDNFGLVPKKYLIKAYNPAA